ncbi:DUF5993 family protein [Endozoicomonas sp. ALD068]|uniref:DUF5993 family protein n=2 Tax=Endozoicomonas TaxID=305899 RepID=UPI003BB584DF
MKLSCSGACRDWCPKSLFNALSVQRGIAETVSSGRGARLMPYALLSFIFILFAMLVAWFNRRWGIVLFSISLVLIALIFMHHISEHLEIYL